MKDVCFSWARRVVLPCLMALWTCLAGSQAQAGEVLARVRAQGELKVCIWPAYQGITWRDPRSGRLAGLDIEMAEALGADLHLPVVFVDSSFPALVPDLLGNRCDVAMFGIAMVPGRTEKLAFTAPYLHSDIHAISLRTSRMVRQWADIDQPGVLVGVQAGTYMEPVMRERLRHASLVVITPPLTRERELLAGRIDVFMTDYPYGHAVVENVDWAALIAPSRTFHMQPYAYASKPGDAEWLATLNAFVARVRQDGRLAAAAKRHGLESITLP